MVIDMALCIPIQRKITKICVGSLNRLASIFTRDIDAPIDPMDTLVDYRENFTLVTKVYSMIETISGQVIFDDISIENTPTHNIYIRYISGITQENWITDSDNTRYNILNVIDLDHNKRFMQLSCVVRGDASFAATEA